MMQLVIAAYGDNEALHREALKAAVEAVERVNKASVYRAWLAKPDRETGKLEALPNTPEPVP